MRIITVWSCAYSRCCITMSKSVVFVWIYATAIIVACISVSVIVIIMWMIVIRVVIMVMVSPPRIAVVWCSPPRVAVWSAKTKRPTRTIEIVAKTPIPIVIPWIVETYIVVAATVIWTMKTIDTSCVRIIYYYNIGVVVVVVIVAVIIINVNIVIGGEVAVCDVFVVVGLFCSIVFLGYNLGF